MIRHDNIKQQSPEWHEIKWGKIGGTLSKGLFVNSDTLFIDIFSQRLEDFEFEEESFKNSAMERGNEMEPFARKYISDYTGIEFKETGWLQSEENELLGISPDGISECEKYSCEIKCFGRKAHHSVLFYNEIPLDNLAQCLHYFTVNPKLEKHYFLCFRPESKKHFIKELTRKSIINLGTKAKPIELEIDSWVIKANKEADILLRIIKDKEIFNESNF